MITTNSNRLHRTGLGLLIAGAFALAFATAAEARPVAAAAAANHGKVAGKDKVHKNGKRWARRGKPGARVARVFARLDLNRDGVLGPRELAAARPRMQKRLATADANRDGRITKVELLAAAKTWKRNGHRHWRKRDGNRNRNRNGKAKGTQLRIPSKARKAAAPPRLTVRDHRMVRVPARLAPMPIT